jgi:hypothetical protein
MAKKKSTPSAPATSFTQQAKAYAEGLADEHNKRDPDAFGVYLYNDYFACELHSLMMAKCLLFFCMAWMHNHYVQHPFCVTFKELFLFACMLHTYNSLA